MPRDDEAKKIVDEQMDILKLLEEMKLAGNTELHLKNPKTGEEIVLDLNDLKGSLKKLQDRLDKK